MANSKLDFKRVGPVFFLVFVDILGLTIILPLLHLYAAAYGASPLEIGLTAAAFPIAQLIGVPVMGALSDRYGRKPLLLVSQITTFLSFILLGVANSLLLVILSRVVDGLFGANLSTAQAALTDLTDDDNRAQGLGLIGAAFGIGFIFGPLISTISLSFTDDLSIPAYIAAVYSLISILLTLFVFKESHPPEKRGTTTNNRAAATPVVMLRMLRVPVIGLLLVMMFAQQFIFFGFESLLGLFTLNRIGLLGQGTGILFLYVGVILVVVQGRMIGIWTRKYGEARVVNIALTALAAGLILMALTPEQPHPFYVRQIAENELLSQIPDSTEAIIGNINVELPADDNNGLAGILWLAVAIIPIGIGSGLIRPSLNSLMTKQVTPQDYGSVLGVSAAFVSAANATAPLLGGAVIQQYGMTLPFLVGGVLMGVLAVVSLVVLRPSGLNLTKPGEKLPDNRQTLQGEA